jgi:transcription elongation factor GreA
MTELTRDEMQRLQAELDEMKGPRWAAAVDAIAVARGFGDLSENFEYHAAKNDQGLLAAQITTLEEKLRTAVVVDEPGAADGGIGTGSVVEIEADGERMKLTISNAGGSDACSPDSPLGKALRGAREGDTVDVPAPGGSWAARVVSVS